MLRKGNNHTSKTPDHDMNNTAKSSSSPESAYDRSPVNNSPGPASNLIPENDNVTVSESNSGYGISGRAEPADFVTDDQIKMSGRATIFDPTHEIYGAIYNENGSVTVQLGPDRVNVTFDCG